MYAHIFMRLSMYLYMCMCMFVDVCTYVFFSYWYVPVYVLVYACFTSIRISGCMRHCVDVYVYTWMDVNILIDNSGKSTSIREPQKVYSHHEISFTWGEFIEKTVMDGKSVRTSLEKWKMYCGHLNQNLTFWGVR